MILINRSKLFDKFFTKMDKPREIKHLVLHNIGGFDRPAKRRLRNINLAIETLKRYEVSSHYIVGVQGEIFQLVEENDIAHHAGVSNWGGCEDLNKTSIGIEFFNPDPQNLRFTEEQIRSGVELCQDVISHYDIEPLNVVGHSDIAYFPKNTANDQKGISGHLNRKDDPSHLFPWESFARSGVSLYPRRLKDLESENNDILLKLGDSGDEVLNLKRDLKKFGYKIDNMNDIFDEELKAVITVFNRRFGNDRTNKPPKGWSRDAQVTLSNLLQISFS